MNNILLQRPVLLGQRICELRKERRMSQEKLAEISGVSVAHIYRIEKGIVKRPSIITTSKIAEALGVDLNVLLKE